MTQEGMVDRIFSAIGFKPSYATIVLGLTIFFSLQPNARSFIFPEPSGLSLKNVKELARKRFDKGCNYDYPMDGKVAVITGCAGGIGSELCRVIHSLGGTVVAIDRDAEGLKALQKSIYGQQEVDDGRLVQFITDHGNLEKVANTAEEIKSQFGGIDILVNNAGIGYPRELIPGAPQMISAHGKDLAFTVNYLSHFLLTEKLLENLSNAGGRIIHLSSTFHWKVDGSELLPAPDGSDPLVYRSNPKRQSQKHVERSYANTKLAQIWHSRSIQSSSCSSVCACPTWAATGIAGDAGRDFLQKFAFPVSDCGPGVTSAINAILRTDDELGDALNNGKSFVANSRILEYMKGVDFWLTSNLVTHKLGWRDFIADILAAVLLFGQRYTHSDFIIQKTSPESFNDENKRAEFYQWSRKEVSRWL